MKNKKEKGMPSYERRDHLARTRREVEAALILEDSPYKKDDEDKQGFDGYVLKWLEKNTKAFKKAFDELSRETDDVVALWKSDRDKVLLEIKKKIK